MARKRRHLETMLLRLKRLLEEYMEKPNALEQCAKMLGWLWAMGVMSLITVQMLSVILKLSGNMEWLSQLLGWFVALIAVLICLVWLLALLPSLVLDVLLELSQLGLSERLTLKWMQLKTSSTFETKSKGEKWAIALGWFIPRKYRNDIIGDILEDCAEMREVRCTERRIKFHVIYQWLLAVITLVPASIIGILRQVIIPPK